MRIVELPAAAIAAPDWNPNRMDPAMRARLRRSIDRFGMVVPLVARKLGDGRYETIGGAQRLAVLKETGVDAVPCVLVQADDARARLLGAALNRIAGSDDIGMRAEALRRILESVPRKDVLALLPETAESLASLASLGQEDLSRHLQAWRRAQAARLKHLTVQLAPAQLDVVEEALARFLPDARPGQEGNPNRKGVALYRLCLAYLRKERAPT